MPQTPASHAAGAPSLSEHGLSQVPQLFGSVCKFAHASPPPSVGVQKVVPAGQLQVPPWQVVPGAAPVQVEPFVTAGLEQVPASGLQVPASWHWSIAVQLTGMPPTHVPLGHVNDPKHKFVALQGIPQVVPQ